jgi:hypothetical protein
MKRGPIRLVANPYCPLRSGGSRVGIRDSRSVLEEKVQKVEGRFVVTSLPFIVHDELYHLFDFGKDRASVGKRKPAVHVDAQPVITESCHALRITVFVHEIHLETRKPPIQQERRQLIYQGKESLVQVASVCMGVADKYADVMDADPVGAGLENVLPIRSRVILQVP